MMAVSVLGIDLGKNSCSVVGLDNAGKVVLRRRVPRDSLAALLANCRLVSWRWRRAVVPTSSDGWRRRTGTRFG